MKEEFSAYDIPLGTPELTFKEFAQREVARYCYHEELDDLQKFELMLSTQPNLQEALIVFALSSSVAKARMLIDTLKKAEAPDPRNQKATVIAQWQELVDLITHEYGCWPENPDGDDLIRAGVPMRIAKYADTWRGAQHESEVVHFENESLRARLAHALNENLIPPLEVFESELEPTFPLGLFLSGTIDYYPVDLVKLNHVLRDSRRTKADKQDGL